MKRNAMRRTHRGCLVGALAVCILAACSGDPAFVIIHEQDHQASSHDPRSIDAQRESITNSSSEDIWTETAAETPNTSPHAEILATASKPHKVIRDFQTPQLQDKTIIQTDTSEWHSQSLTMARQMLSAGLTYTQVSQPRRSESFQQGMLGQAIKQTLQQNSKGILDILVVIDNSNSMKEEQKNLASKLGPLLSYVSESNWRIGVMTTDASNACMREVIRKGESDAAKRFSDAVSAGVFGSGNEHGIFQAVAGLKCQANQWLRADSTVAVLIVSDEDNCSINGLGCAGKPWATEQYLIDYLNSIRTAGENARAYGIFSHPTNLCSTAYNTGVQYARLVEATGGTWGDICDADYSQTLRAISADMRTILRNQWELQHTPDSNSIVVKINGNIVSSLSFSLTENVLSFIQAPPENARIDVDYRLGSSPIIDRITLASTPLATDLHIRFNGIDIASSDYEIIGREIRFASQPPHGSQISVNYIEEVPLARTFGGLPKNLYPESLQVTIGDKHVQDFLFSSAKGTLFFVSAPPASSSIVVSYRQPGAPILGYELPSKDISALSAIDLNSGEAVNVTFSNGQIIIQMDEYRDQRQLEIRYRTEPDTTRNHHLPESTVQDLLETTFSMEDLVNPDAYNWQVFVNNQENTNGWERTGQTIRFFEPLPAGSKVQIIATIFH